MYAASNLASEPLSGAMVIAIVLTVMALAYASIWRRDREPKMGWFAASLVLFAVYDAQLEFVPIVRHILPVHMVLLVAGALATRTVALVQYFEVPSRWQPHAILVLLVAPLAMVIAALLHDGIDIGLVNAINLPAILGLALLAAWAASREPGVGHDAIAAALLFLPAGYLLAQLSNRPQAFGNLAPIPTVVLAVTLLNVSLNRRRQQAQLGMERAMAAEVQTRALADSLEARIRERTAELERVVDNLHAFNRNVSHDLRGPLGGISGLSDLIRDAMLSGDQARAADMLEALKRQADLTGNLLSGLLHLAHAERTLTTTEIALDSLTREMADLTCSAAPDCSVVVHDMPRITGDVAMLRLALINLLGNAVKFARPNVPLRIDVGVERCNADGLVVYIRDNGIGFSQEVAEQLFTPFFRGHAERYAGHGIGLSIVARVMNRHQGTVSANGQVGRGACFLLQFPASTVRA